MHGFILYFFYGSLGLLVISLLLSVVLKIVQKVRYRKHGKSQPEENK